MAFRDDAEREARHLADRLIASADAHADRAARQAATAAQAAADALREELRNREATCERLEGAAAQLRTDLAETCTARDQAEARCVRAEEALQDALGKQEAVRREIDELRSNSEEAWSECARLSEALQAECARQDRTERALSAAEKARHIGETERHQLGKQLEEAEARVRDLERLQRDMEQACRDCDARLESAMTNETAAQQRYIQAQQSIAHLQKELLSARRIVDKANAEYEAATTHYRSQLAAEASAREIVEGCLKAERATSRLSVSGPVEADALERVRTALDALASRTTANDLFEALLDQLAADFTRVALFVVHQNHLEGWSSRGLPPAVDISNVTIPLSSASPLTRAATRREPAALPAGSPTSLFGGAVACGVAFPLLAGDAVVGVVYAEQPQTPEADFGASGEHVARILSEQVSRQLTALDDHAAEPSEPVATASSTMTVEPVAQDEPVRPTDRVKVFGSRAIRIDRATGVLVDLSRSGAQVLLPCAVRPQQALRIQLPGADGTMRCQGRVVWVRFELVQAAGSYRAGIQFTDVDAAALETFLSEYEPGTKESRAG